MQKRKSRKQYTDRNRRKAPSAGAFFCFCLFRICPLTEQIQDFLIYIRIGIRIRIRIKICIRTGACQNEFGSVGQQYLQSVTAAAVSRDPDDYFR